MNMQLIGAGDKAMAGVNCPETALRRMSAEQLLQLGVDQVAYVRTSRHDGVPYFLIHGADGVLLTTVDRLEQVMEIAAELGFEFVTVH
ncbi:MAG TPA: hypothetical protein VFN42_01785 [Acetobacteraceae bacterium]|nr:hypothetical protein [Acetobacteraceae bacterium]